MTYKAPAGTRVGHVHLRVADLERAVAFYTEVLGFEVMQRAEDQAAFLGIDGYHHHLVLNTWASRGGTAAPRGHTGLYHAAFLYSRLEGLRDAVRRVVEAGVFVYGASDHGVSVAVYFDDPDGNALELYWDRPRCAWPRAEDGSLSMISERFKIADFIAGRVHESES